MKFRKNKKGFTIVELIIVIAVIGVLTAVMVPTIVHLVGKANKASDEALVSNLNKASQLREVELGKPVTMHDAVLGLEDYGYKLDALVAKSDQALLYDLKENRFLLANEAKSEKAADYWRIQDNADSQDYNIYASSKFTGNAENLTVGFDAGFQKEISSISYVGSSKVLINTNGNNLLTINNESAEVRHLGKANTVDVQKVASSSYYEEGEAVFLKLAQGRAVIKEGASVGGIHVEANNAIVAVEEDVELPVVTYAADVTSFYVQETNEQGEKQAQSTVTIAAGEVSTAASEGSTAVPAAVATKVEASEEATAEEAKEKTAEVITPDFEEKYVAAIGWQGYETLKGALDSVAKNGSAKIVLLKDAYGDGLTTKDNNPKSLIIDLGGHSYLVNTGAVGSTGTENQAMHWCIGSDIKLMNGKFGVAKDNNLKMAMQNYGTFVAENVEFDFKEMNIVHYGVNEFSGKYAIYNGLECPYFNNNYNNGASSMKLEKCVFHFNDETETGVYFEGTNNEMKDCTVYGPVSVSSDSAKGSLKVTNCTISKGVGVYFAADELDEVTSEGSTIYSIR